jgi:hypothetical protein
MVNTHFILWTGYTRLSEVMLYIGLQMYKCVLRYSIIQNQQLEERKNTEREKKKPQYRKHYISGSSSPSDGQKQNKQLPMISKT